MSLKLKVYKDEYRPPNPSLPWLWLIVSADGSRSRLPWDLDPNKVQDYGYTPDGVTALRVGLYALAEALKEGE